MVAPKHIITNIRSISKADSKDCFEKRCMTSMIERIMHPIITKDCWKILIECVENTPRNECINLLGVYSVQIIFDVNTFFRRQ